MTILEFILHCCSEGTLSYLTVKSPASGCPLYIVTVVVFVDFVSKKESGWFFLAALTVRSCTFLTFLALGYQLEPQIHIYLFILQDVNLAVMFVPL